MTTSPGNNPPTIGDILAQQVRTLERLEELASDVRDLAAEQVRQGQAIQGLATKLDGLVGDIALVKGGHAISAARRRADVIASSVGCESSEELPRRVIADVARVATEQGQPLGEVQSFRHADLLLYGWESDGQPCYVAVEVSFTVNAHDVRRAARNADYLQKYTGIPAHAVVAGVDVPQEAQARIELGEAHLYQLPARSLQPD
jgi:hypothetical protein